MTRTGAWRTLAIAFDTPRDKRTVLQRDITESELCWGLLNLEHPSGWAQLRSLQSRAGFWWPRNAAGDLNRAVFAGLMAAMSQRERDRLVKGL
jgi:hypothetical protein